MGLGTGGRPDAILNLDWTQIDLPGRSIRLNALARLQTNKRRAEVPICSALASHLRDWGEQDGWMDQSFASAARRFQASRSAGKAPAIGREVAALLGHKMPGYSITEMYAGADPRHMKATKAALDDLLRAICLPPDSTKLERAKGFEPSTLTLAT